MAPRLLVGLGNPGSRYERTRHNVGFEVVDRILVSTGGAWDAPGPLAVEAETEIEGREVTIMKPLGYMNRSGGPVARWVRSHGIERTEVLVYLDEAALPVGTLRLRQRGTDAGHRGLASVLEALGGTDVPRLRIGIRPRDVEEIGSPLADFVLAPFTREEMRILDEVLDRAVSATRMVMTEGMEKAMSIYNRTSPAGPAGPE